MSVGDLLRRLVEKLDAAGVPHMVAGSFASTYHGVPRSTQDIDIVIDPTPDSLVALLSSLSEHDSTSTPTLRVTRSGTVRSST